jgi:hypothetical protein
LIDTIWGNRRHRIGGKRDRMADLLQDEFIIGHEFIASRLVTVPAGGLVDVHHVDAGLDRQNGVRDHATCGMLFGCVCVDFHLAAASLDADPVDLLQFIPGQSVTFT